MNARFRPLGTIRSVPAGGTISGMVGLIAAITLACWTVAMILLGWTLGGRRGRR
jgi:hypothetical protein